ncbi:hypothetical protein [Lysobacter sp. D1-1-M9]|uniref:hypothetical protein n=1 Tax=Novilysobacter longmucuonensis TaxID=3098603 RepID=UPI002FC725F1
MRPAISLVVIALLATLPPCSPARADEVPAEAAPPAGAVASPSADPRVGAQLDELEYRYEVDRDGDYRLTFDLDEGRSQLVYVISAVERFGAHRVREIWAPAYRGEAERFPEEVANRLLEDAQMQKLGGWVKQGDVAMFVVKIAADASTQALDDGIDHAIRAADWMETELTGDTDEF